MNSSNAYHAVGSLTRSDAEACSASVCSRSSRTRWRNSSPTTSEGEAQSNVVTVVVMLDILLVEITVRYCVEEHGPDIVWRQLEAKRVLRSELSHVQQLLRGESRSRGKVKQRTTR